MNANELIDDCLDKLKEHLQRIDAARAKVDEEGWNRRTPHGEWSPGEVLEHLCLSIQPYLERIGPVLKDSKPDQGHPVTLTWFGKLILKNAGPAGNAPPPSSTRPGQRRYTDSDYARWRTLSSQLAQTMESCKGLDLGTKIKNPIIGFFPMNLADCFAIIRDHNERHVRQIEQRTQA